MTVRFPQPSGDLVLRDVHVPPPPPWWPPAPGWWVLAGIACVILLVGLWRYRRHRRVQLRRRRILAELHAIGRQHRDDDIAYAASVHQLLRRAARLYADDAHHLQGEPWRKTLACVPVNDATLERLMTLEPRMYQPHSNFDRAGVQLAALDWLEAALKHEQTLPAKVRHA